MNIQFPILFRGSKAGKQLTAVFDPETLYSFLPVDFAKEIGGITPLPSPRMMKIFSEDTTVLVTHANLAEFRINNVRLSDEFMLLPPAYSGHAIIGITTIRKWRLKLDVENNTVIVNPEVARLRLGRLKEVRF